MKSLHTLLATPRSFAFRASRIRVSAMHVEIQGLNDGVQTQAGQSGNMKPHARIAGKPSKTNWAYESR